MSWQSAMYNLIYRRGKPRWDTGMIPPALVALVEGAQALRRGRAIDLGCGTGTHALYLAQHGWAVTGIDFSGVAIRDARRNAGNTPNVTFIEGDATKVSERQVAGRFDLALDIGCFHGIPTSRRDAYAEQLARVAAVGATFLLWSIDNDRLTWVPGAPSANEHEIRRRFEPRFKILSTQPGDMLG